MQCLYNRDAGPLCRVVHGRRGQRKEIVHIQDIGLPIQDGPFDRFIALLRPGSLKTYAEQIAVMNHAVIEDDFPDFVAPRLQQAVFRFAGLILTTPNLVLVVYGEYLHFPNLF